MTLKGLKMLVYHIFLFWVIQVGKAIENCLRKFGTIPC